MATERTRQSDDLFLFPDELDPPITDDAALPVITKEDIAHAVERLEAGRELAFRPAVTYNRRTVPAGQYQWVDQRARCNFRAL